MKKLLILVLLLISKTISAQDVIVKKDGSTILSKVLEVNSDNIRYKKHSNLNGPTYTININELLSVNYENGEKDVFSDNRTNESLIVQNNQSEPRFVNKSADLRNSEIISMHNKNYEYNGKKSDSKAKKLTAILGIKSSSILSNEDIEMTFIRTDYECFLIYLNNKTNKTIFIDTSNCFKIYNDNSFKCFYDNNNQITINQGNENGASLGLGSVAAVLGIGGNVGQIAGGVSVGRSSSNSVSRTYSQQRVIPIPPHGKLHLTKTENVQTRRGNLLREAEYENVGIGKQSFFINGRNMELSNIIIKKGETKHFTEDELPWKNEIIITYSTNDDFSTFSTIKAEFYIHEIVGSSWIKTNKDLENQNNNYILISDIFL